MNALSPAVALWPARCSRPRHPFHQPATDGRAPRPRDPACPNADAIGPVTFHEMLGHFGSAEAALEELPALARTVPASIRAPVAPSAASDPARGRGAGQTRRPLHRNRRPGLPRSARRKFADAPPLLSIRSAIPPYLSRADGGRRRCPQRLDQWPPPGDAVSPPKSAAPATGRRVRPGAAESTPKHTVPACADFGTVAVLAGGVDVVYPPENESLYREIIAHGAVVTEAPLGAVNPRPVTFPRRNRIVSGLASAACWWSRRPCSRAP